MPQLRGEHRNPDGLNTMPVWEPGRFLPDTGGVSAPETDNTLVPVTVGLANASMYLNSPAKGASSSARTAKSTASAGVTASGLSASVSCTTQAHTVYV